MQKAAGKQPATSGCHVAAPSATADWTQVPGLTKAFVLGGILCDDRSSLQVLQALPKAFENCTGSFVLLILNWVFAQVCKL